ncbi:RHS repeat-associated protein [Luteibacter jiangsuensis]|uniref:RHS repeat-associated protein n=1 Tax=Luteibacter jiangsuensis TaxID=637577 RepID=A0ABT9T1L9_9GAMM|nr:RHS repeat-associated core domain-containing protein [Luteibacter jiangsuensis]MDQ0011174.1 RHS repeat-associated protein [Luteibacter jiangsuensis]
MMHTLTSTYGAYGGRASSAAARTAFAGEVSEADTGFYLLGARFYSTTLRRFLAPDRASPFGRGGINRYTYCSGDPVNRIDPNGRTWLRWLAASSGLAGKSTGAASSVSPVSRDTNDAATTPAMMTSTAAPVADTVTITAAVDSVALMASNEPKAGGLFGWIGHMANAALGGSHLPTARNGSPTRRFVGGNSLIEQDAGTEIKPVRNIAVFIDGDIPAHRSTLNRNGNKDVTRNWIYGTHVRNPKSRIWAADTAINYKDLSNLFPHMTGRGITNATFYSGAHGKADGDNWAADRFHKSPDRAAYEDDLDVTIAAAAAAGLNIDVENMGDMLITTMRDLLARDGDHVIATCYGIADPVVMEALNQANVSLYYLRPPPAP